MNILVYKYASTSCQFRVKGLLWHRGAVNQMPVQYLATYSRLASETFFA